MNALEETGNILLLNLLDAGIRVAIGFLVWLALHYVIRFVVKRTEKGYWHQRGMRWAQPVIRNIDPMMRALDNERRIQRAQTIGTLLNSIATVLVVVLTGFYVLLAFNVNIAPLVASVGVVGIAIGFGSQQLIRDFLAGIFLTLEDQYGIGDIIQTSEVIGRVEYLGLRVTRVMGEDGTLWYLRNGEILRLGNRSKGGYVAPTPQPAPATSGGPAASGGPAGGAASGGPAGGAASGEPAGGAAASGEPAPTSATAAPATPTAAAAPAIADGPPAHDATPPTLEPLESQE
ncbi:hypothetical protein GCM10025779_09290 [Arthrobacter cryoconiti]